MQKSRHFEKARQFALHFLIYKNTDTLRDAIFHGNFEIGGGRGGDLIGLSRLSLVVGLSN